MPSLLVCTLVLHVLCFSWRPLLSITSLLGTQTLCFPLYKPTLASLLLLPPSLIPHQPGSQHHHKLPKFNESNQILALGRWLSSSKCLLPLHRTGVVLWKKFKARNWNCSSWAPFLQLHMDINRFSLSLAGLSFLSSGHLWVLVFHHSSNWGLVKLPSQLLDLPSQLPPYLSPPSWHPGKTQCWNRSDHISS